VFWRVIECQAIQFAHRCVDKYTDHQLEQQKWVNLNLVPKALKALELLHLDLDLSEPLEVLNLDHRFSSSKPNSKPKNLKYLFDDEITVQRPEQEMQVALCNIMAKCQLDMGHFHAGLEWAEKAFSADENNAGMFYNLMQIWCCVESNNDDYRLQAARLEDVIQRAPKMKMGVQCLPAFKLKLEQIVGAARSSS